MEITLKENDSSYKIHVNIPTVCPRCGRDLVPDPFFLGRISLPSSSLNYVAVVLCPQCRKPVYLDIASPDRENPYQKGTVIGIYPHIQIFDLPTGIEALYPDFTKVYCQAALAEARNLSEICGMGYRKALEFLVKQYAQNSAPEESDTINNEPLAQTINRIDNPRIKTLAKASAWLGNDQTHLQVKHPEYSVDDIKSFIKSLCYYILMEEEVSRAENLITKSHQ